MKTGPASQQQRRRIAIIGAGPCGLAAAKNALAAGFETVVYEKGNRVGGNWVLDAKTGHSSVYENTHLISSKAWSEFEDFPMPDDYPEYPRHDLVLAYFEAYAQAFGVAKCIRFEEEVIKASPLANGGWRMETKGKRRKKNSEDFDALFVANGHHNLPRWPKFEGKFTGQLLHSHDFKSVGESWRGKNVLVIGGGNSAADVAVEAARVAKSVQLSMRSSQWFVPKFILGVPADVFSAQTRFLPRIVKQYTTKWLLRLLQGRYSKFGLPDNDVLPLSQHPTLNSDLLDYVRHGRIKPRPAVHKFEGKSVRFVDGTRQAFDIICCCTGFWMATPFLDSSIAEFQNAGKVRLYRKMIPETAKNLYFVGFIQPLGCIWPLADYQARLACAELSGKWSRPADLRGAIDYEIAHPHQNYKAGLRHATEVDYHRFRSELGADLRRAGVEIGQSPAGRKGHYKLPPKIVAF